MAQIDPVVRQDIADAADGYLEAYLGKQAAVSDKTSLLQQAETAYDTAFTQANIPIEQLELSQNNARELYSGTVNIGEGYDAQMAVFAPTIVSYLTALSGATIDFQERGKRISLSGNNIVVSNI